MNRLTLCASSVLLALSGTAMAAPATPSIDLYGSNNLQFSKIELAMDTTSGYDQMVTYKELADIKVKFNQWSGSSGDTYTIYFDGKEVATGQISGSSTTASFQYGQGGRYEMTIEACDATGCSVSAPAEIVIADTDGAHLDPLVMNIDPNNKTYNTDPNTVVGTYFVEWGIYGRDYTVDNIPVDNLTHIIYGFIPICGNNESVKSVGGNSFNAVQTACRGMNDYEVVIHDPWAAYQKSFKQAGHDFNTPIKGNYAMLMALKKNNPDLKILPSIGGWTLSDPFFAFTEKANRDVFVASVREFLKTWKFYDGVDIDWEFPGGDGAAADLGDPVKDGPAYIALMRELRAMLDELEVEMGREYELSSAIGMGYDKIEDVDYAEAVQYMDYIFAMTYDFYGGWNNVPGHQAALYCGTFMRDGQCDGSGVDAEGVAYKGPAYTADNGIQALLAQGVPANKIVLGAAMYGRGWEGVTPDTLAVPGDPMTGTGNGKLKGSTAQGVWEDGVIDYKGVKKFMLGANEQGINGFQYGYDEQAEAAYVWNPSKGTLITFDDRRSTLAKGQYARDLGLAGLFSWEIDADNGDILNAMHEGLAGVGGNTNAKPVAKAGADITVEGPASVALDGSNSSDRDGQVVSYAWQQTAGASVTLTGANSANASFDVAEVSQDTVLSFTLTVTDNKGATAQDTVNVTVKAKPPVGNTNEAPVLTAPASVNVNAGDDVSISVSASDADNDALTFSSSDGQIAVNGNSATISMPTAASTTDSTVNVTVTVTDGTETVSKVVTVNIKGQQTGGGDTGGGDNNTGETTWNKDTVYTGGDTVMYNGVEYAAKWWTKGDVPGTNMVWEKKSSGNTGGGDAGNGGNNGGDAGAPAWSADTVYTGGKMVTFEGATYKAKWWTKGNKPTDPGAPWTKM